MPRLIWVFAGRTCHFVGFVTRRLKYVYEQFPLEKAKSVSLDNADNVYIRSCFTLLTNFLKSSIVLIITVRVWEMLNNRKWKCSQLKKRRNILNLYSFWFSFTISEYFVFSDFAHKVCAMKPIWAASWQNQQSGCAPSEDSDQPGHLPSLIRVFAVRSMGS